MKNVFQILTVISLLILASHISWGQTCDCNTVGSVALGASALSNLTTGTANVGIGTHAGQNITTGKYLVAIGHQSLKSQAFANDEYVTALGFRTGYDALGGMGYSTIIGANAAVEYQGGGFNTMLGWGAGWDGGGKHNLFLGGSTGRNIGDRNIMIGVGMSPTDTISEYSDHLFIGNHLYKEFIVGDMANGRLGINTNTPENALDVCGAIRSNTDFIVDMSWCDYVFYDDYQLPELEKEELHIKETGHLSGFESEETMNGQIKMGDVTQRQQVKIEEMMLHLIDMNKRINQLESENIQLKQKVKELQN